MKVYHNYCVLNAKVEKHILSNFQAGGPKIKVSVSKCIVVYST